MAFTDIYYIDNSDINRTLFDSFTYSDVYGNHHLGDASILTHQPQQQEATTTMNYTACEKKDNSLLYTSNEFINKYQFHTDLLQVDDHFPLTDIHHLQASNQLTPLLTPSPQLSELHSVYSHKTDVYIAPSPEDMYLFDPIDKKQPKQSTTTTRRRKISPVKEKTHICPVCDHRSKRKHNLIEHMLTHNPHRPKTFLCGHCDRPFARKYDMKRHEKIHTR